MSCRHTFGLLIPLSLVLLLVLVACHSGGGHVTHRGGLYDHADQPRGVPLDRDGYRRDLRSGTLTAGHFDDGDEPVRFADWAERVGALGASHGFIAGFDQPAIQVTVVNEHGDPVPNAVVRLVNDRQGSYPQMRTGTDGRCVVLPGYDGITSDHIDVAVNADGCRATHQSIHAVPGDHVEVVIPGGQSRMPGRLDLALVIDTTGSMGDELEYLKVEFRAIAERIAQRFPRVDQRWALVVYRDKGDAYVVREYGFTSSLSRFVDRLGEQHADGGGDYPEAVAQALAATIDLRWRDDSAKVAFLVADAPPHPREAADAMRSASVMRDRGVALYPVASSGVQAEAEYAFRAAALMTGGVYSFLTDDSGVGNPHAEPHEAPAYSIQRLDDLMVQLVESELMGAARPVRQREIVREVPVDSESPYGASVADKQALRDRRDTLADLLTRTELSASTARAIEAEIAQLDRRLLQAGQ